MRQNNAFTNKATNIKTIENNKRKKNEYRKNNIQNAYRKYRRSHV